MDRAMFKKDTLLLEGMSCAACARTIELTLQDLEGVYSAQVNLAAEKAYVEYDPGVVERSDIEAAITGVGYGVKTETAKVTLAIGHMNCAACASKIERNLQEAAGVKEAAVNLAAEKAYVKYDPAAIDVERIIGIVTASGYKAAIFEETKEERDDDLDKVRQAARQMWGAWAFTVPIMLWMLPGMIMGIHGWPFPRYFDAGLVMLAAPVVFWVGRNTLRSGIRSLFHGSANMDSLIALGSLAAFATGPAVFFTAIENYAGTSAMIMSFHLTGRYIENKAKGRASQAIKKLLQLEAKTARILVDGQEKEVPLEQVKVGDVMVIRPGEKVPTDGVIVAGRSSLDESMATGESMPVQRTVGEEVIGATINHEGLLQVKATKVGKDTFLAQVIKMVEECQGTKVPIQEFADRVTGIFVPTVMTIAALTLVAWLLFPDSLRAVGYWAQSFLPWVNPSLGSFTLAIFATVAVLVIACPCALGLATPTALMVGTGLGAENGILIRSGEAIQTIKELDVIVFDKTGTITKGKPEVTDIVAASGFNQNDVLLYGASAEAGSEHPLGKSIVDYAKAKGLSLLNIAGFSAVTGRGVRATVDDQLVLVGSRKLMTEQGIDPGTMAPEMNRLEEEAKTAMLVARGGQLLGIIAVADTLKEDSVAAIAELKKMGLTTAMITGDNERTAAAIAREVGISQVLAEVLPDGKVAEIQKLQAEGKKVAMVGDGINDAPALTQANVGIAIGTGTDIAIEAADITLVGGNLSSVVTAVKLSKATFAKIKQNLFWAFFYNSIAIPLAVLGLLHPVIAEIAMATSSVTVVTNANLLRRVNIKPSYHQ
ncbi:MAG: heavy metal translocating P-type ATPase [bacterium]